LAVGDTEGRSDGAEDIVGAPVGGPVGTELGIADGMLESLLVGRSVGDGDGFGVVVGSVDGAVDTFGEGVPETGVGVKLGSTPEAGAIVVGSCAFVGARVGPSWPRHADITHEAKNSLAKSNENTVLRRRLFSRLLILVVSFILSIAP